MFSARRALRVRKARRQLRDQVALVTGGSRGLGLALARELLEAGCRVAICGRDVEMLNRARAELKSYGPVVALPCDVSNPINVADTILQVSRTLGPVDLLIANAGEISVGPVLNATVVDFERAMDVMFWGAVYPVLAMVQQMRHRGHGRIAIVTSIGGKISVPHLVPYCSAKFAAVGFSEGLRAELAGIGIPVTTVIPFLTRTGSHLNAKFKGQREHEFAWFALGASLPFVSMSARSAAREIVDAVSLGEPELVLSRKAKVATRVHGMFPGLTASILAFANRLLPRESSDSHASASGWRLMQRRSRWFRALSWLGLEAAKDFNQALDSSEARLLP
jgi:NAD(P)-dependent dehydrogenase (short-subunit alcohol dehydrogenase family)